MRRYAFCPVCGSALDRASVSPPIVHLHVCGVCTFEFWQNSKPAVAAIIVRTFGERPHILLCTRSIEPYKGMWDLPGGFLNNGEHPEQGLAREIREELGTSLEETHFLTAEVAEYPREDIAVDARFVLGLYYVCTIRPDAALTPADDVADAEWFPLDDLPDAIAFSANTRAIESFRQTLSAPASPAPRQPFG